MDLRSRMEIYIPVEAEVKSIHLWSLPNSVLRRMGLPVSDSRGSKKLKDSPTGIWICPAVIRRKGQKQVSHTENDVKANMVSLLGTKPQSESGSYRMSFVSSSRTAYKVLKETVPGKTVAAHTSQASQLPQGSSLRTCQDAVVIYNGQIYLSIKKPNRSQRQQETREPPAASQSLAPLPSDISSSKSQKKELLNDNKAKKKGIAYEVTHSENKKGVRQTVRNVSLSKTAPSVPESTVSVDRVGDHCHEDARAEQTTEEATVQEPDRFQPQEEQEELENNDSGECEMQDLGGAEAESIDHLDGNIHTDSGEADQGYPLNWNRMEPLGAAFPSTSLQNEFDFKELEEEETIARMKAKVRQKEAALSSMTS